MKLKVWKERIAQGYETQGLREKRIAQGYEAQGLEGKDGLGL